MPKPIIKELWMLWLPATESWALAVDDPDPYEAFLCATSFDAIVALQKHQWLEYEIRTVPVRVK